MISLDIFYILRQLIILSIWEFFSPADCFPQEFKWQQVSSSL